MRLACTAAVPALHEAGSQVWLVGALRLLSSQSCCSNYGRGCFAEYVYYIVAEYGNPFELSMLLIRQCR